MRSNRRSTSVASASGAAPAAASALLHPLLRQALAVAGLGEQLVLDDATHAGRLVGQRPLVELRQDRVARAREQVGGDLRTALREPHGVQFAADERQQRRLDLGVCELGAARHEPHDRLGHLLRDQPAARLQDRAQRLRAGHAREPHAVLRDRGHRTLHALEVREVVLAQRDQDSVIGAGEVVILGDGIVLLQTALEIRGRAVLDEVGEVVEEPLRAQPACVVRLRQREDLLELVEDQKREERAAAGIAQQVAAMVQELPERLALDGRAGPRPVARGLGRAEDRLLDLFGRRRRIGGVVHPHVDGAIALAAQPRHESCAQQRGLAEAGLAEQHRQELALHTTGELRGFLVAAVEVGAALLGVRGQAEPRILGVDWLAEPAEGRAEAGS